MKTVTETSAFKALYESYIKMRTKAKKEKEYNLSQKEGGATTSATREERS